MNTPFPAIATEGGAALAHFPPTADSARRAAMALDLLHRRADLRTQAHDGLAAGKGDVYRARTEDEQDVEAALARLIEDDRADRLRAACAAAPAEQGAA